MGSFNSMDLVILLGVAQGLFLAITLPMVHRTNTHANTILSMQIAMACLVLFAKVAIFKAEQYWVIQRAFLLEPFIFLYGPLGYIYLKRLLEKGSEKYRLHWVHYIPALIYLAYLVYLNVLPTEVFANKWSGGDLGVPFFLAELLALVHNCIFWYFCGQLIFNYHQRETSQLSFVQQTTSFIRAIHILVGFILFLWMLSFLNGYYLKFGFWYINYDMVWIGIPVLIYIVGYYALRQPEIFRIQIDTKIDKGIIKQRLPESEIEILKSKLEGLIETEKVYLKNELTLTDLSQELDTTTNNLSWLLNNIYQSNFYEFINKYRIEAFLKKIRNNEHATRTLLSLSLEVGFNSKSTFNKAFKSVLNDTPSNYIKKMGV
ncbi:MAG: AraC family transcriptional regulator [Bacteroidota bacterium]